MTFKPTPYLSKKQCEALNEYKYAGGCTGITFIWFYNPLANYLVNFFPEYVAPNVITLIGFIFSSMPFFVLFSQYGTKFENEVNNPIPQWFFFFYPFCYFWYRMFDEMDGKQARRTGNSGPLGLLFDHGCDAFSMGFNCMVVAKCV